MLAFHLSSGGMATGRRKDVQQVAARSIALFDARASGSHHAQSKRFLDSNWSGLNNGPKEPPLRPLMTKLAAGEISLHDLLDDGSEAVKLLFYWISAFRLVRVSFDQGLT